jgi:hypothetical protein
LRRYKGKEKEKEKEKEEEERRMRKRRKRRRGDGEKDLLFVPFLSKFKKKEKNELFTLV